MSMLNNPVRAVLALAAVLLLGSAAFAKDDNEVRHLSTRSGLHFYAGGDVDVTDPAETAFVAGGTVRVSSENVGEIIAAGGTVDVPNAKTSRIIAAGGTVKIRDSEIAKTVIAAGGSVKVRDTRVLGDVILSGGDVNFKGDVGGDFIAAGGDLDIGGQFAGDVTLRSADITLAPDTHIAGNLTYASHDALSVPAGVVDGTVTRQEWRREHDWFGEITTGKIVAFSLLAVLGVIAALSVFAGVVLIFFARQIGKASATVTEQPLQSLGLGVLLAIVLPVTMIVLMITIIGIPLGLFTMAAYGVLFGLGIVVAAYWLGMKLRKVMTHDAVPPRYAAALGWTLLGLVVFTLVGMVPLVGNLAQFFALVTGFGAFILAVSGNAAPPQIAAA